MTAWVTANLALLSGAPGGVERLRSLIVELAVLGRLVPQQLDDEPGADLAVRLTVSKTQAMTDGGRRAKALDRAETPIWPFEVPESWTWQMLDDLLWITGGVTLGRKLAGRALVALPYLRVANVQRGHLMLDDLKDVEVPADEVDKYLLRPGDLLITEGGDWDKVGRTAIWRGEIGRCLHQNHIFRARGCSDEFLPRWAELYLNSTPARNYFAGSSKQTTNLASINMAQLRSCAFPLPPLPEQHRIVAKVDELMALCDRLEARQQDAEAAHARLVQALLGSLTQARDADEFQACWQRVAAQFSGLATTDMAIDALRAAVLELAFQGRLTARGPNKPWQLVKLGSVAKLINGDRGSNYPNRSEYVPEGIAFINTGHINPDGSLDLDAMHYLTREKFDSLRSGKIEPDDLVYCLRGATLGKTAFVRPFTEGAIASSLVILRFAKVVLPEFAYFFLVSPQGRRWIWKFDNGSAQPNLAASSVREYEMPLPSLDEQRRVVSLVTELLALCDQLKARIAAARAKHAQLAQAIVASVVA
jgi:type I restriction enzyme S subunit